MAKKSADVTIEVCPHCGYCPHCGRRNLSSTYPYYPVPYYPYPHWYTNTTGNETITTTTGVFYPSMTTAYLNAQTTS